MFVGSVRKIGDALKGKIDLQEGDRIASLVSLSLTPLRIDAIHEVRKDTDQVDISGASGQAILFESAIYAKLPAETDIPEKLALAVLDVAGAPAQTAHLVKPGDTVMIIGAAGKSGLLCAYEAKKRSGVTGKVIGVNPHEKSYNYLKTVPFVDHAVLSSATTPMDLLEKTEALTDGKLCDVVINCVNVADCEMGSILCCKEGGTVYFFSMATSFTKAALGAEGIGKRHQYDYRQRLHPQPRRLDARHPAREAPSSARSSPSAISKRPEVLMSTMTPRWKEIPRFKDVSESDWNDWTWQMSNQLIDVDGLKEVVPLTTAEENGVRQSLARFRMAVTPYYASLIDPQDPYCPVRLQAIPRVEEVQPSSDDLEDPLAEDADSPVPGLTHRYPDRVLLLVTQVCSMYCRHCTRRRLVGEQGRACPNGPPRSGLRLHPRARGSPRRHRFGRRPR